MPDEPKQDSAIERWADKILRWLTPLILAYIATLATGNHQRGEAIEKKVETVQTGQEAAVVKTEEVKHDLDKRAAVFDAKAADDAKATTINLYGTWKWLDENAITPADKVKAAEAKAAYESFVAKSKK